MRGGDTRMAFIGKGSVYFCVKSGELNRNLLDSGGVDNRGEIDFIIRKFEFLPPLFDRRTL
jgi:hypothetical protein